MRLMAGANPTRNIQRHASSTTLRNRRRQWSAPADHTAGNNCLTAMTRLMPTVPPTD